MPEGIIQRIHLFKLQVHTIAALQVKTFLVVVGDNAILGGNIRSQ